MLIINSFITLAVVWVVVNGFQQLLYFGLAASIFATLGFGFLIFKVLDI